MLGSEFVYTIPGQPKTKGSMKCIGARGGRGHQLIEDHKSSGPWREHVVGWLSKRGDVAAAPGQPLGAEVTFTLPRPKSHYRSRRNPSTGVTESTGVLTASAPTHPVGRNTGDVDKLARLILDALQDGPRPVIPDDAAVVDLTTRKRYPTQTQPDPYDVLPYPGVRIRLYPL